LRAVFANMGARVLDEPAVGGGVHGAAEELARGAVAIARLTVLGAGRRLDEHTHDTPYLSLHLLGSYREQGEAGEVAIDGPAAAFHPAGSAHADAIGGDGLATVVIEFDPSWLARAMAGAALERSRYWVGGPVGRRASRLARAWLGCAAPRERFAATQAFLRAAARGEPPAPKPAWLAALHDLTAEAPDGGSTADLARALGVTPAWLTRAYRESQGEGLGEALRRRRVEAAVRMLTQGALPLAQVACEAGFCDQSHMNRAFNIVLGRTPATVRAQGLARRAA